MPSLLLSGCDEGGVLDPQGPVSAAERLILINATGIMLVIVVPVILLTLTFAFWYRASNTRAIYKPDWDYSGQIELVVWSIPAMIVILLAGVGWISAHQLDPRHKITSTEQPIHIDVVSLDWKWLFIYQDQHVATVNQLMVPSGTPIEFQLTSGSVMNAFFIPQLGTQIYTMPGMTTHLNLMADHPGDYPGLSSHFSGGGFSDMHFVAHAMTPANFGKWVTKTQAEEPLLNAAAYTELAHADVSQPKIYGSVDPGMFERIIDQTAPFAVSSHQEN